jgi:hypothetical protein
MTKFVIAAVAAALLGSTSVSLANDSGRETYQSPLSFNLQQAHQQVNSVRDARAQTTERQQAVRPFTAAESAWFARNNPQILN